MHDSLTKIIYSKRRTVSISVSDNGYVLVRAPKSLSESKVRQYMDKNKAWITKKLAENKTQQEKMKNFVYSKTEISKLKKEARQMLEKRVFEISKDMELDYRKFRLSGAGKRWGSCSNKKTISLNWRLIFAPKDIVDYVTIHELAHLRHMNHSKKYWTFVSKYDPDYKSHRKWLNENDFLLRVGESPVKD